MTRMHKNRGAGASIRNSEAAPRAPVLLLVGSEDEAFHPRTFAEIVPPLTGGTVEIVAGLTHLECAYAPEIAARVIAWLRSSRPG